MHTAIPCLCEVVCMTTVIHNGSDVYINVENTGKAPEPAVKFPGKSGSVHFFIFLLTRWEIWCIEGLRLNYLIEVN